jgi:hypothetical protein
MDVRVGLSTAVKRKNPCPGRPARSLVTIQTDLCILYWTYTDSNTKFHPNPFSSPLALHVLVQTTHEVLTSSPSKVGQA